MTKPILFATYCGDYETALAIRPGPHLVNGMLTILLDPQKFTKDTGFADDVKRLVDFVKSSRTIDPDGEILLPGELEARTRAKRIQEDIELDDRTWSDLVEAAASLGVSTDEVISGSR